MRVTLHCLWIICLSFLIPSLNCTSLPIRNRERSLLLYPAGNVPQSPAIQLQPILQIPQASTIDRVDINQKGPFLGRIQTPNELFLVYPNGGPVPGSAQSPSFNEIYPNINFRPALDPNAVFLPGKSVGSAGRQPGIEPDAVLISNLRPGSPQGFQPGQVFVQDMQPNPEGGSGGSIYPGFVGTIFNWIGVTNQPANPNQGSEDSEQKPMKIQVTDSSNKEPEESGAEPAKLENPDKPIEAGEQEILAAADKNPNLPAKPNAVAQNPENRLPGIKPGQRFFILNGQPQFYSVPVPQLPYEPLYLRNIQNQQNNPQILPQQQLFQRPNIRQQENQLFYQQNGIPNVQPGFKLAQPEIVPAQNSGKVPGSVGQFIVIQSPAQSTNNQQADQINPETENYQQNYPSQPFIDPNQAQQFFSSRQIFGPPFLLRNFAGERSEINSGPNPGSFNENVSIIPRSGEQSEQTKSGQTTSKAENVNQSSDAAALEFARYISEKQEKQHAEAISSPQDQRHENVEN